MSPLHESDDASDRDSQTTVRELRAFLVFLQTIWGLLAGISTVFPLSNVLVRAIPLGAYGADGVFDRIPPALISTLATVVTLFVMATSFGNRAQLAAPRRAHAMRGAWASLAAGLLCLGCYVVLHSTYAEYAWEPWGWGSGDPRKLWMEIPLAATYIAFFALLTRAFVVVAIQEYYRRPQSQPRDPEHASRT